MDNQQLTNSAAERVAAIVSGLGGTVDDDEMDVDSPSVVGVPAGGNTSAKDTPVSASGPGGPDASSSAVASSLLPAATTGPSAAAAVAPATNGTRRTAATGRNSGAAKPTARKSTAGLSGGGSALRPSVDARRQSDIALVTLDDSDSDGGDGKCRRGAASAGRTLAGDSKPRRAGWHRRCVNRDCHSRTQLVRATQAHLAYFTMVFGTDKLPKSVKSDGRRVRVCLACRDVADEHNQMMTERVKMGKPLLDGVVRQREDEVCLDSDEEGLADSGSDAGDVESVCSDDSMISLGEDVHAAIARAMRNVQFDHQIDTCIDWLQRRNDLIDESFARTERELAKLEKDIGYLYEDLYRQRPPTSSAGTIELIHTDPRRLVVHLDSSAQAAMLEATNDGPQGQQTSRQQLPIGGPAAAGDAVSYPTAAVTPGKQPTTPSATAAEGGGGDVWDMMITDVVQVGRDVTAPPDLPPLGIVERPCLETGQGVFSMHTDAMAPWFRARIKDIIIKSGKTCYSVKFESARVTSNKRQVLDGRAVAHLGQPAVQLHVGVRVVAAYRDHDQQTPTYYSGTIGEAPKTMNQFRYLVFFDDGYAKYVPHRELMLIHSPSSNVSLDVPERSRDFIAKYLSQFPERPMVKLHPGQLVKTEWEGRWLRARVMEVDMSLVKMVFESERRTEWIYRGSTRLAPMYAELVHQQPRKLGTGARRHVLNNASQGKKNRVYVEYRRDEETAAEGAAATATPSAVEKQPVPVIPVVIPPRPPRAVARKSTTPQSVAPPSPPPTPSAQLYPAAPRANSFSSPISPFESEGQIVDISPKPRVTPRRLQPHICSSTCIRNYNTDMGQMKGQNPLIMPMMCGWIREIVRYRASKRTVVYRAPCGRRLRCMQEVHSYMRLTGCLLQIDCFCFDFWVHCFTEFEPARKFCSIKDLSYGKENVQVSCVNSLDRDYPDFVEYSTMRIATSGVDLNLDSDFLVCCDCTDDCQDKSKCSCWQSTIQGSAFGPTGKIEPDIGYQYRRLLDGNVITGIYECNSRCKCRESCLNRSVQHPLRLRLQVFKTLRRGWGIRCLDDIPKGGFICVYAGQLLTEASANEDGKNYGDEYLAELDFIEVLERRKEGYESDVEDDDDDETEDETNQEDEKSDDSEEPSERPSVTAAVPEDDDDDFVPTSHTAKSKTSELRRSNRARQGKNSDASGEDSGSQKKGSAKDAGDDGASKKKTSKRVNDEDENLRKKKTNGKKVAADKAPSSKEKSLPPMLLLQLPDPSYRSVREHFGENEYCYIMDAKTIGNIGRYLNHSCSPNVFVQNVFVDTQDLRFPWVAFFALSYIRAGTELTWDYNYEVGSVPGKVMYCHCGSQECRGRLL